MLKVIPPGSYDFGEEQLKPIRYSSKGLVGHDYSDLVKAAGEEAAIRAKKLSFKPGEYPVHLIALGSTESVGPNRNGDGFKEAACRKYHDTFVKYGRYYRNHKNKDKSKSYGIIKESWYNEEMKRVELIVALNGTKKAAEENGGLVAEKEIDTIEKGGEVPVSMCCHVPYDVCSGCGHKSKTKDEYCDERICTKYGGLKENMGKLFEDGHILHADNPKPKFFDISTVFRPADRTAYILGKLASHGGIFKSGAEIADELGLSLPEHIAIDFSGVGGLYKQASFSKLKKFAEMESKIDKQICEDSLYEDSIFDYVKKPKPFTDQMFSMLESFAMEKIALSVPDFLRVLGVQESDVGDLSRVVRSKLPGIYSRMLKSSEFGDLISNNPYMRSCTPSYYYSCFASSEYKPLFSSDSKFMLKRAYKLACKGYKKEDIDRAYQKCKNIYGEDLADFFSSQYALYKIAFAIKSENYVSKVSTSL